MAKKKKKSKKPKSLLQKYNDAVRKNDIPAMTAKSRRWFLDLLEGGELNVSRKKLLKDPITKVASRKYIGKMYMFVYDPKHKKTLPYYDKFPLIILADRPQKGKGFYGLNLHYLRPRERAVFLSKMFDSYSSTGDELKATTKLRISYAILKSAAKMKAFAPTFKRYLPDHIQSAVVEVPPEYWEVALFLPTQNFKKASVGKIWRESRRAYR
jgi:hypothetical protein